MCEVIRFSDFRGSGCREADSVATRQKQPGASATPTAPAALRRAQDRGPREHIEKVALELFEIASKHNMKFLAYLLIMAVEEARAK